jgi:hypothetical protein
MPAVHHSIVNTTLSSFNLKKCETTGKIKFNSKVECLAEAARLFQERGGPKLNAYHCNECQSWHFTSKVTIHK